MKERDDELPAELIEADERLDESRATTLDEFLEIIFQQQQEYTPDYEAFRTPLFEFVWKLKGRLPDIDPISAVHVVGEWLYKTGRGWTDFVGFDSEEDAIAEFFDLWEDIRFAHGRGPLTCAYELALRRPLRLPVLEFPIEGYRRFLSMAYHLSQLVTDAVFYLPVRAVAKILGLAPITISRYRRWAVREGFLRVLTEHSVAAREATEFKFVLERVKGMEP